MHYDSLLTESSSIMQLNKTLQMLVRELFDVQIQVTSGELDVRWIFFKNNVSSMKHRRIE